ncbi:3377_t:CDS:10 [Acaulospora morrowiae]|uniref:E3 ubiquitin protein ligase n=1 Tax=Acaulospora morrowiae TaxID=94023 RepID=A0A9N8ZRS6_9GLOM|nr:3377_t:CDS:10 [Acaulospora morrowiae]
MSERKRNHSDAFMSHGSASKKPHILQTTSSSEGGQNDPDTNNSNSNSNIYHVIANVDISDPEWLEKYQKEAIFRALKEYQRQAERALEFNQELVKGEAEYKNQLERIEDLLEYLQSHLKRLDDAGFSYLQQISTVIRDDKTLEDAKNIVQSFIEKIFIWLHEQDVFIKTLQSDKNEESQIVDFFTHKTRCLSKIYQNAIETVNTITRELETTKASLESTSQQLETAQDKLAQLEKNIDRSNSFTLNPYLLDKKNESNDHSSNSSSRPIAERMELSDLRALAEARLKECNDSQAEKVELRKRIYEIQEKFKYVPEERVKESEKFKSLELELNQLRQSYDHLLALFDEKTREVQNLTASRDKADDLLKSEMKRMDQEFQEVKQEYLSELDRIRAKRNELVKDVETLRSMIPQDFRQNSAIRMLASDRMEFINILKEEIRKLNIKIAAYDGNKSAIEQIRNVHLSTNELTFRESQGTDLTKYITDMLSYKSNKFEQRPQDPPASDLPISQNPTELLSRIKDLEDINEILKNNEKSQSHEIEIMFNQLEKRDDANHKKAFEICSQDQRVYTLKQSLTKFQQRLNAVTMENVSLTKERSSMAVVIQNQINVIRQNSYLLTNYKSQLENHKREADNAIQALAIYKQKLQEYELELKREKTASENLRIDRTNKAREFSAEVRKRGEELKTMFKESRHVKEQLDGKNKQIEELKRTQSSTVSTNTLRLLEVYETKWKCSTCNTRFKDHCLTLCMHAFCKTCLERQLEGRNRKCANCGQQFSKTDIRQIYF